MRKRFIKSSYILGLIALGWAGGIVLLNLVYVRPGILQQTERIEQDVTGQWFRLARQFAQIRGERILRVSVDAAADAEVKRHFGAERKRPLNSELLAASMERNQISVLLCDTRKRTLSVWGVSDGKIVEQEALAAGEELGEGAIFQVRYDAEEAFGVGRTPLGLAIFARCRVHRANTEELIGYIVSIRLIDDSLLAELSELAGAEVRLQSECKTPPDAIVSGRGHVIWRKDEKFLKAANIFRDSMGKQVGYLVVEGTAEPTYRQARAVRQAFIITLLLAMGFTGLMILVIHEMISGPAAKLLNRIERLRSGRKVENLSEELHGEALGLAEQFEEVLSRVEKLSHTDSLTGLCNRRSFEQSFSQEIQRAHRYGRTLSLAIMDIDFFKAANDAFGHQTGDLLLKVFAEAISRNVREPDTVARLGGDEFAVLMPETTAVEAAAVIERVRECLASKSIGQGELKMSPTISVGIVALNAGDAGTPDDLIELADQAMYAAKRAGRNQIVRAEQLDEVGNGLNEQNQNNADLIRKQLAGLDTKFKHLFIEAIGGLTSALEARDEHTVDHSAKVCRYAMLIARGMNLPERTVGHIARAAMLHDIGKISLPDSILLKEGELTEKEWVLVRQHPVMSARIMEGMGFMDQEIPAVRFHHERYDGTGYPDGLSGSSIPLGARILAVADAFDAMTSSRTYRGGLGIGAALDEIRRCSGTQFDPAVVKVFLEIVENGGIADITADETVCQPA